MDDESLTTLIRFLREEGMGIGQCCVVPEGVFFYSRRSAENFANRHDKELVEVAGQVSGWLAKNKR